MRIVIRDLVWTVVIVTALAIAAQAQSPAPPSPATAQPSCESLLKEAQSSNATVVQLWRDVSRYRNEAEIAMAAIRAALGADCAENKPVSQCVVELHARYTDTAQRLVKATAPAKPADAKK